MLSRRRRSLLLAVSALVLAAPACSLEVEGPADPMVVVDDEGRVVTVDRDGDETLVLGDEDDAFQPVWAPHGDLVAYATRGPVDPELVVVARNGGTMWRVVTPTPPFYLSWGPGSSSVGMLRQGEGGDLVFETVRMREAGDDLIVRSTGSGAPFYFSWSLSADRVVTHVGNETLDLLTTTGEVTPLDVDPAAFQAPQWTEDGIYAFAEADHGDQAVLIDTRTQVRALVDVTTPGWLAVSPDGNSLAVQTATAAPGATIAAPVPSQDDLPRLAGGLGVVDLDSSELTMVSPTPVAAFFWSPDSASLLLLSPAGGPGRARWSVWTDGTTVEGPEFEVAPRWLAEFVPFFDQYARSMTLWSPQSDAFAFPGTIDGRSGIWVHDIGTGDTEHVIGGDWVAWGNTG